LAPDHSKKAAGAEAKPQGLAEKLMSRVLSVFKK
jgi:hypothetical protein